MADKIKWITARLDQPYIYKSYLRPDVTVVHMAAVTGSARRNDYFAVNYRGTQILLEQCLEGGVPRFVHVSSIAAKYHDKRHCYYAQSKEAAERIVAASGLNYTIVRPTIVLARRAAAWRYLGALGRCPFLLIPGNGRTVIQPIYISDFVRFMVAVVGDDKLSNCSIDVGGAEAISIEEFLQRIHEKQYRTRGYVFHLPWSPILTILSAIERALPFVLPVTSGQLAAFINDGAADSYERGEADERLDVGEMLDLLFTEDGK